MFTTELCIPEWSALFRGHFEGEPILSGVAQLILLRQLVRRFLPGQEVTQLERVRFKASAGPREPLRFELSEPDAGGQLRITITRDGDVLTQGVIRLEESR